MNDERLTDLSELRAVRSMYYVVRTELLNVYRLLCFWRFCTNVWYWTMEIRNKRAKHRLQTTVSTGTHDAQNANTTGTTSHDNNVLFIPSHNNLVYNYIFHESELWDQCLLLCSCAFYPSRGTTDSLPERIMRGYHPLSSPTSHFPALYAFVNGANAANYLLIFIIYQGLLYLITIEECFNAWRLTKVYNIWNRLILSCARR